MKSIIFALIALSLSACASFKSEETLRQEYFAQLAERSPEQVKLDNEKADCAARSNAYGGSTVQGHQAAYKSCMYQKGL